MTTDETQILPPKNPLTAKLNMAILDWYFRHFMDKWLPTFKARITSGYRDEAHNKEVGGAQNSAHLHGLAYDFVLEYPNGERVPKVQAKKVFDDYIAPNWAGFALWEDDHIHVNLSRQITEWAAMAAVAGIGVIGFKLIQKMGVK